LFADSGFNPHKNLKYPIQKYSNAKSNNKGSMFSFTFNKHVNDSLGDHPLGKENVGSFDAYVRSQPSPHIKNDKPAWPVNIAPSSIKEQ